MGTKTLSELLSERDTIAKDLKSMIDTATDPWGIDVRILNSKTLLTIDQCLCLQIERVEVKDVRLPQSLQRAMAAEAEATRDARYETQINLYYPYKCITLQGQSDCC